MTDKQETFKNAIISGETPINAARIAYNKDNNINDNTLSQIAHDNLRLPKIKAAIDEKRAELAAEVGYTVQKAQQEYEEARALAMRINQPAAASTAITGKARLYGMDKDVAEKGEEPVLLTNADLDMLRTLARAVTDKGLKGPQLVQDENKAQEGA